MDFITNFTLLWATMAISAIAICVFLEEGTFFLSASSTAFAIAVGLALYSCNETIAAHPMLLGAILAVYLLVGAVWPWFAWASFLHRTRERYDAAVMEWEANPVKVRNRDEFVQSRIGFDVPVDMRQHKARIVKWMAYWPFSVCRTLITDPLRRLWNALYNLYANRMKAMADKALPQ